MTIRDTLQPAPLDSALLQLSQAELVRRLAEVERAYMFKHALVQETVHATLLRQENKRLHRLVAFALEEVNATRLDEYAAQLAQHFYAAEEDAKTLEYSTRAGGIAARVFANDEALAHYGRAIEIAKQGRATNAQIIHLYKERGRILEVIGKYFDAVTGYVELHELARQRGDRALELAYLMLRAPLHSAPMPTFDAELAKAMLLDALGMARELRDEVAEARVLWNLTLLSVHTMRPADGIMYGEQSLALCEKLDLREQKAFTLHDLFMPYRSGGHTERARAVQARARALFRQMENKAMLADSLGMSAQFALFEGNLESAIEYGVEGLALSRTIGNPFGVFFNQSFLANVYLERGEYDEMFETIGEQIDLVEGGSISVNAVWLIAVLGWFYASIGAFARSEQMERVVRDPKWETIPPIFRSALCAYRARIRILRGDLETAAADLAPIGQVMKLQSTIEPGAIQAPIATAELALAQGDYARALQTLQTQAVWIQENEFHLSGLENGYLMGRTYMGLGDLDAAEAVLTKADTYAQAMNARRVGWQILAARSELERRRGNREQAEAYRVQARAVLEYILANTPDAYREGLENVPAVREVLA